MFLEDYSSPVEAKGKAVFEMGSFMLRLKFTEMVIRLCFALSNLQVRLNLQTFEGH